MTSFYELSRTLVDPCGECVSLSFVVISTYGIKGFYSFSMWTFYIFYKHFKQFSLVPRCKRCVGAAFVSAQNGDRTNEDSIWRSNCWVI